jgi:hypothetical protein
VTWIDWVALDAMVLSVVFLVLYLRFMLRARRPEPCRKCRYLDQGKWDGAASVAHAPGCPGSGEDQ